MPACPEGRFTTTSRAKSSSSTRISSGTTSSTTTQLSEAIARHSDPRQKILAVFDTQAERFRRPDFNGCAFVAASTEAPAGGVIDRDAAEFRQWIRTMFTDLADPGWSSRCRRQLGRQLHVLYDGAGLTARMDHDPGIAVAARAAVAALLDAALP